MLTSLLCPALYYLSVSSLKLVYLRTVRRAELFPAVLGMRRIFCCMALLFNTRTDLLSLLFLVKQNEVYGTGFFCMRPVRRLTLLCMSARVSVCVLKEVTKVLASRMDSRVCLLKEIRLSFGDWSGLRGVAEGAWVIRLIGGPVVV